MKRVLVVMALMIVCLAFVESQTTKDSGDGGADAATTKSAGDSDTTKSSEGNNNNQELIDKLIKKLNLDSTQNVKVGSQTFGDLYNAEIAKALKGLTPEEYAQLVKNFN